MVRLVLSIAAPDGFHATRTNDCGWIGERS